MEIFEIVNAYHYYMWNAWSEEECGRVFSELDAAHQWDLWDEACRQAGSSIGAVAEYWAMMDALRRHKLTDSAVIWYLNNK